MRPLVFHNASLNDDDVYGDCGGVEVVLVADETTAADVERWWRAYCAMANKEETPPYWLDWLVDGGYVTRFTRADEPLLVDREDLGRWTPKLRAVNRARKHS